ncbi:CHAD domain-containing protein [Isosphaeraceae bacterium EP7]
MAFQFKADESVAKRVRRIAGTQIDQALGELKGSDAAAPEDVVHRIRQRLRKVRALIRLTRGGLGGKLADREDARFRDAGRPLSELRDASVLVQTLDRLAEWSAGQIGPESIGPVRDFLLGLKGEVDRRVLDEGKALEELVETLEKARREVKRWEVAGHDWDALEVGLRRIYKRGLGAFHEATDAPTDEGLHEWRKRVKDLRYALDMLLPIRPGFIEDRAVAAHWLADLLGEDHDLVILRDSIQAIGDGEAETASAATLLPLIDGRRAELQRDAIALGRDIFGERPGVFVARFGAYWRAWRSEAEASKFDPP